MPYGYVSTYLFACPALLSLLTWDIIERDWAISHQVASHTANMAFVGEVLLLHINSLVYVRYITTSSIPLHHAELARRAGTRSWPAEMAETLG